KASFRRVAAHAQTADECQPNRIKRADLRCGGLGHIRYLSWSVPSRILACKKCCKISRSVRSAHTTVDAGRAHLAIHAGKYDPMRVAMQISCRLFHSTWHI